jgi:hypothetical protein
MIHLKEREAVEASAHKHDGDDTPRVSDRIFTVLSHLVDYVPSSASGAK